MKKLVFELKDFSRDFMSHGLSKDLAVQQVQTKFNNWFKENIENAPVVYGTFENGKTGQPFGSERMRLDTHQARLIDIQEIKKECVKHEPRVFEGWYEGQSIPCKHCQTMLSPEWKEVKP